MGKAGFIGLGVMGSPMARQLIESGQALPLFDVVEGRIAEARELGGIACGNPRDVAKRCSLLFLMVLDQRDIETVLFGENGAIEGLEAGDVVVIMSTVPAASVQSVAQRLEWASAIFA